MRVLRWLGDAIWVYLIPIAVVLNVIQPPPEYIAIGLVGAVVLTTVTTLLFALMIAARVLLSLTQRHTATPDRHG